MAAMAMALGVVTWIIPSTVAAASWTRGLMVAAARNTERHRRSALLLPLSPRARGILHRLPLSVQRDAANVTACSGQVGCSFPTVTPQSFDGKVQDSVGLAGIPERKPNWPRARNDVNACRVKFFSSRSAPVVTHAGERSTLDFRVQLWSANEKSRAISFWHDVPLYSAPTGEARNAVVNMVNEIPKMSTTKFEIATKVAYNPIKHDIKDGKLRFYHGPIYWNYGALPRTWEDPAEVGSSAVKNAKGDNDPIDVVEIGERQLQVGEIVPVKVLGALSMLDSGELDWKIIAVKLSDSKAQHMQSIEDVEKFYPHTVSGIMEWFRWYKVPDGKPLNDYGHQGKPVDVEEALTAIAQGHSAYKELLEGGRHHSGLWLPPH